MEVFIGLYLGAASGGGGLCNDDLFVLNIVSEKWSILNVEG
jgi:hypothetical protein